MHILVTGGAGFIGSNFVRMLLTDRLPGLEGASVTVLDALTYSGNPANLAEVAEHPHHTFVHGDIRDTGLLDRLLPEADAVVHFAAERHVDRSVRDASVFVETNVVGTQRLLDAALRHDLRRFVQLSTDEVYGAAPGGPASEEHALDPHGPYAASKAGSDLLARSYHRTHGLDVRIARCASGYGPHQSPEQRMAQLVTRLLDGGSVPVHGDGDRVREWLHVDDLCRGIALVLTGGRPGEAYNIGGGAELTERALVERLLTATGRDATAIEQVADDPDQGRTAASAAKIADELGYAPQVPLDEGIATVVQWYREHRSWWEPLLERAAL